MYEPNRKYQLSTLVVQAVDGDGSVRMNHILGRANVALGQRWALFASRFAEPATAIEAATGLGFSTRQVSSAAKMLRRSGILQVPGNDEEERIRHAYRYRAPQPDDLEIPPIGPKTRSPCEVLCADAGHVLALGTVPFWLSDDELLVGRLHRPPVHVTSDLWHAGIEGHENLELRARARALLTRLGILCLPRPFDTAMPLAEGEWCAVEPPASRFRQIAEPYGLDLPLSDASYRVHLVGPCQIQGIADALEWQAARRGVEIRTTGEFAVTEAWPAEPVDVVVMSAAQFGTRLLDHVALGELADAEYCLPEVMVRTDAEICKIDAWHRGPIVILSARPPGISGTSVSGHGRQRLEDLFHDWTDRLSQLARHAAADLKILSEDAVGRMEESRRLTDDTVTALHHHAPLASGNWVTLKPGVTDEGLNASAPTVAVREPPDAAGLLARALLRQLEAIFAIDPIKLVILDPTDLIWPIGIDDHPCPRPLSAFADVESYLYAGVAEALFALDRRGVKIACLAEAKENLIRQALEASFPKRGRRPAWANWMVRSTYNWPETASAILAEFRLSPNEALVLRTREPNRYLAGMRCVSDPHAVRGALFSEPAFFAGVVTSGAPMAAKVCSQKAGQESLEVIQRAIEQSVRKVAHWPAHKTLPDDMRSLGLDSLDTLRIALQLEERFQVSLAPADFTAQVGLSTAGLASAFALASRRRTDGVNQEEDHPWLGLGEREWAESSFHELLSARRGGRRWCLRQYDPTKPWTERTWTSSGMLAAAAGLAALVRKKGCQPGQIVLVCLPEPGDRAIALIACLIVGTPVAFCRHQDETWDPDDWHSYLGLQLASTGAVGLIRSEKTPLRLQGSIDIVFEAARSTGPELGTQINARNDFPALVLATSGSTGLPKIYTPSVRQVLTALWHVGHSLKISSSDVVASWLPHHHNFGLNLSILLPILTGARTVLMPSDAWSRDPRSYLHLLSECEATVTFAPSSALAAMADIASHVGSGRIDLSRLRLFVCSGERLNPRTMDRALDVLADFGLRRSALAFQYGMTETTSTVAQSRVGRPPRRFRVDFMACRHVEVASNYQVELLSSGEILPCHKVRIVSDEGKEVADGEVGNILVSGECIANINRTVGIAPDRWTAEGEYRTGDIGLLSNGELFVKARSDDVVIVNGVNVCPGDVETVADLVGQKMGVRFVAFGIDEEERSTQRLVVVGECTLGPNELTQLRLQVTAAIRSAIGVTPIVVVLEAGFERTASGKIDRRRTRERVLTRGLLC